MAFPCVHKDGYEPIQNHYAGKSVFITGGTGFLGKVFVEKLLYSCPDIQDIYLLIRKKNKSDATQRIKQLLELPVFERVRKVRPENMKKVVPVNGDVISPNLDINEEYEKILIEKVSHVFHFAANVKFNETLKRAMECNVEGTRRVLDLCKRLKKLEVFVYVSTAFTNTDKIVLEEIIYPFPVSVNAVYKLIEQEEANNKNINKYLCGRPNTYTFTKALAESLVKQEHGDVPTIIVRPSVVSASSNEPMVGWIDNWFGATALITTIAKGLNRILLSKSSNVLDLIPVDYVSNLIIAAAAKSHRSKEVLVYNSCTSAANPLTMGHISRLIVQYSMKHNFNAIIYPTLNFTKHVWLLKIVTFIVHIIPAFVGDFFLYIMGKSPRYIKMQKKALLVRNVLQYFTANSWEMRCQRTRDLFASLSASDRILFPFDPVNIAWEKYVSVYMLGVKKFLLC